MSARKSVVVLLSGGMDSVTALYERASRSCRRRRGEFSLWLEAQ